VVSTQSTTRFEDIFFFFFFFLLSRTPVGCPKVCGDGKTFSPHRGKSGERRPSSRGKEPAWRAKPFAGQRKIVEG
jgi:hypothetical protein